MSINSAMLAGVTGLTANASALAATSDNIANTNTVGYKLSQTEFSDLVTSAGNLDFAAGGVQALARTNVTQQGILQSTTSPTDLAISGNGFFVTTQSATGITPTSPRLFTRAGSFTVDNQGNLKNAAGLYLQGWPADANGNITTDPSNIHLLQPINVSTVGGAVGPTTTATVNANLNAAQAISTASTNVGGAGGYSASSLTTSMAAYNAATSTGTKPDFTITVPVADSQGGARSIQIDLLKSAAAPNTWYAEAVAVPASDVTSGTGLIDGQISTGVIAFTPDGRLDTTHTTLFGGVTSGGTATISLGASSAAAPAAGASNWAASLGINAQTISLDLSSAAGGLTQFSNQSVVQSIATNGTAFGNLTSINIDANGLVTANFDNSITRTIAQLAIATFPNPDGLAGVSGDAFQVTQASGTYNLKTAGSGGAGTLSSSSLEASTVDLSTEFANLITTQRAYSASSKIITTADSMLQDLINIIR
jgi:flagellar hook protein FlgE